MKKLLFGLVLMGVAVAPAAAFVDTAVKTISGNITAVYDKAYQEFMKVQVIEQTRAMVANYNESKIFYDRMKEISENKGGILGYVRDDIKKGIDAQNNELYWKLNRDFVHADGEDSFVGKSIRATDKNIQSSLDYSEEIHKINLVRDRNMKSDITEASRTGLKPEEREKLQLKIAVTQMEILNDLNKTMQQILMRENERAAKEWAATRSISIEDAKMKSWIEQIQKQGKGRKEVNPYRVLEETPQ